MTVTEKTTTWLAAGAVASPAWLPSLKSVSEIAGYLLPILGVIWLAVQIGFKVREYVKRRPKE